MVQAWPRLVGCLLVLSHHSIAAIDVEVFEILNMNDFEADGEFEGTTSRSVVEVYGGVHPIDDDCEGTSCIGMLTRDGSLELDSRYGCTQPSTEEDDDPDRGPNLCGVTYDIVDSYDTPSTLAAVKIAFHPNSTTKIAVTANNDGERTLVEWEGVAGTTELQEIAGLEGIIGKELSIEGFEETGAYLGILEVEIYVTVDEVEASGVSASTRASISATATTDETAAMNTVNGDVTDSSSWTCLSGEACEITYDLQAVQSLEQVRIAFSDSTDGTGELNVLVAGESGVFASVSTGFKAGGRPSASDGLQTFGGVRALARYVKLELVPVSGGTIIINEASMGAGNPLNPIGGIEYIQLVDVIKVDLRVGEYSPIRPVTEKSWLKETGALPQGGDPTSSLDPKYDKRASVYGGCDSPGHLEGCHVFYIKDGDMSSDSRWSCSPVAAFDLYNRGCNVEFSLNIFRYVRQIKFAFHLGDEQHDEFSIEAYTKDLEWATVVPSAITSGDTTDYQTFNVGVHTIAIKLVPKFHRVNQWINIKEMVILEKRKKAFVEGTVPVLFFRTPSYDDDDSLSSAVTPEATTRFKFDISEVGDRARIETPEANVTALRMRFPKARQFVFDVEYSYRVLGVYTDVSERFTSAGGDSVWETFSLLDIAGKLIFITAVEGPTFAKYPNYPALRVADFQVVGEIIETGVFNMVTTTMHKWGVIPDIIGDGAAEQQKIMTTICETKGATFDGTDCVGNLDDTPVYISVSNGNYFLDGPIFIKSGVTLDGRYSDDAPNHPFFQLYDGPNTARTTEDAMIVIDGATNAEVNGLFITFKDEPTGDIVPGTIGNLALEVRNSQDVRFYDMVFATTRTGSATFTDSSNITTLIFWGSDFDTGIFLELTRVDDFYIKGFPQMSGLLIDDCNNVFFEGYDEFEVPSPGLNAPAGGDQTANVVITGDSSGITFKDTPIGPGAEPRILMESIEPLTLDFILEYEEAASGDCIIQVPEGTTDDLIVQLNAEQTLTKSGNCWVLE